MGFLGPDFLLCHALSFDEADRQAMVRTKAPVSFSVHSELWPGTAGGFHGQLLRMIAAGITVSLSFDASSLADQHVRVDERGVESRDPVHRHGHRRPAGRRVPAGHREMATINGARALGLDATTGSITPDVDKVVRNAARAAHAVRTRAGGILTPTSPTPPTF